MVAGAIPLYIANKWVFLNGPSFTTPLNPPPLHPTPVQMRFSPISSSFQEDNTINNIMLLW